MPCIKKKKLFLNANVAKISIVDYSDHSWQKSQNQKEREVTNLTNFLRPFIKAYSFVDFTLLHLFPLLRYSNEKLSNFSISQTRVAVSSQIVISQTRLLSLTGTLIFLHSFSFLLETSKKSWELVIHWLNHNSFSW